MAVLFPPKRANQFEGNDRCGAPPAVHDWVRMDGHSRSEAQVQIPIRTSTRYRRARVDGDIPITEVGCHLEGVTGRCGALGAARMESRSISGIATSSCSKTAFASSL